MIPAGRKVIDRTELGAMLYKDDEGRRDRVEEVRALLAQDPDEARTSAVIRHRYAPLSVARAANLIEKAKKPGPPAAVAKARAAQRRERRLEQSGALTAPDAPRPVSSSAIAQGQQLYDLAQWTDHAAGRPVEPLPAEPDPLDLLDRGDVAALLNIEPPTWEEYVRDELAPKPDKIVNGVPHWYRRTIETFQAGRKGRGAGGGRKKGATDQGERRSRVAEVRALLQTDPAQVTPENVRREYKISTAAAVALIDKARTPRPTQMVQEVRAMLDANPDAQAVEHEAARRWHLPPARAAALVAKAREQ